MSKKELLFPPLYEELQEHRNELISIVMRMEKLLRTTPECKAMRNEVKKLMEMLK